MTDMSPPPPPPGRNDHGRVRALINQMIQLQDLVFARDQHEASMPGARLTQLDEAIETMLKQLPMDTASHFRRMRAKGLLAVVPIPNGVCSACAMMIPVSQVHAVRACDTIHQCPSCARYLYHPSSPARRIASRRRRSEPASAGIARFSSPALMIPRLAATTRDEAVAELCRKMGTEGFVDHADRLVEDALRREAIISTAVDHGLAFPHVRGVEGGGLTLALGLSRKGIKFGGMVRGASRLVFFIVIPTAASAFYLKLLSGLTQSLRDNRNRAALLAADTSEAMWKVLLRVTRATVP